MALRGVHAFLILMSAALAVLFGVWSLSLYFQGGGVGRLVAAFVSLAISDGLVVYDSWFFRETKTLR